MNVEEYLASCRALVDAALEHALAAADGVPPRLHEAMRYAVFSGGKRVRPILTLMACEASGGEPPRALPFACALELIHTYSLVHDDLPAMDDDELRRGRATVHVAFGEAHAILTGDALLTEAFALAADGAATAGVEPGRALARLDEAAIDEQLVDTLGPRRRHRARGHAGQRPAARSTMKVASAASGSPRVPSGARAVRQRASSARATPRAPSIPSTAGYVALPRAASPPSRLPVTAVEAVASSRSSATWNARPSAPP